VAVNVDAIQKPANFGPNVGRTGRGYQRNDAFPGSHALFATAAGLQRLENWHATISRPTLSWLWYPFEPFSPAGYGIDCNDGLGHVRSI
jgi:hypothetical protein